MSDINRRKQMIYRANHRGIKEMDIILGGYAREFGLVMDDNKLGEFEQLMDQTDRDLLTWFTGEVPTPKEFDTPLFQAILRHTLSHAKG